MIHHIQDSISTSFAPADLIVASVFSTTRFTAALRIATVAQKRCGRREVSPLSCCRCRARRHNFLCVRR